MPNFFMILTLGGIAFGMGIGVIVGYVLGRRVGRERRGFPVDVKRPLPDPIDSRE